MKKVLIYTDGACSGNPGPGGWGAILMFGQHRKEISGGEAETTNNKMELMAAIQALKLLKEACYVDLFTDSAYMCDAFTKGWIKGWVRNGWKTSSRDPVKNKELWLELIRLGEYHTIQYIKVKGHSDNEFNNRCDELARNAIKRA